ncbi:MAG: acyltransferase, partial [Nitrospira sp.]|nr:acyltransferase [Nitrospira sp.]
MIGNIQLLRAYASLAVVVYHTGTTFGTQHGTDFKGVAIFFVISGFLMCNFVTESPRDFFVKRLIRIVPLYWAATLLLVYLFGGIERHDWRDVAMSLAFIPHTSTQGNWQPTLGVGWTLVLEMYFYTVFAASMAVAGTKAPMLASAVLIIGVIVAVFWGPDTIIGRYLGSFYVLQFVVGICIFFAINTVRKRLTSGPISWLWLPVTVLFGILACIFEPPTPSIVSIAVSFGVPALVVAVALILAATGRDAASPIVILLGNASYAIYLFHTIALEWLRMKGITIAHDPVLVPIFLFTITALSCAIYICFENQIRLALRHVVLA